MSIGSPDPSEPSPGGSAIRFEATVHPGEQGLPLEGVADLDLDRVPDPEGGVRLVITADDAARLVERGFEVRLVRTLPVQPFDAGRVMNDETAAAWLEEQTKGIERQGDS